MTKIDVPKGEAKPRKNGRERALALALKEYTLWHAKENGPPQGYASYKKDGHTEHVELKSSAGRQHLSGLVWKATGEALSRQDLDGTLDALEAAAIHDGSRWPVHVRVADQGDRIFLDLANNAWEVVEVTAQGWKVIPGDAAPVRFRRPNGTEGLPVPLRGGTLEELGKFIHTNRAGLALVGACIVSGLTDRGSAVVTSFMGQQGTAKSTATRVFQRLVDPRGGCLRATPKKDEDLAVAARNSWVVSFDNLSRISGDLADGLCRLSTGAAFATRTFYTNGEETIFSARRPVILNSITDVVGRADLLDRCVAVQLLKITEDQRIEESLFWPQFEKARPRLLGAALTALSGALSRWEATRPDRLPRLSDFFHLAKAIGDELPGGLDAFIGAWDAMQGAAVHAALEASPIAAPLLALLEARGHWKGPSAELLRELNASHVTGFRAHDSWPQTPQGLTSALRRLAPALAAMKDGWHLELGARDKSTKHERLVLIVRSETMAERVSIKLEAGIDVSEAECQAAWEAVS